MRILYHHRTAGDRVEYVHIMGMVRAFRELGCTVEISSPPGCDPERRRPEPKRDNEMAADAASLRGRLKRFARKAPNVLFEAAELLYNVYSFADLLRRRVVRGKPDMIYERTTSNSIAPALLARWWGIPIVQEVNVTADIGRLRPLVLRRTTHAIERWMIRRTPLFLTVSEAFRRLLAEHGFPPERTLVCQNAIHPDQFDPARVTPADLPEAWGPRPLVVGYVGAFVPYHRLDRLIEAAHVLGADFPNARWLLVGEGVERPRVEALLQQYSLADRFALTGRAPHEQVPRYVAAMDVAVLPHSERFNSPMKLFEYMAMGRAVVAPDMPAITEVVKDGVNGALFRAGDAASFTAALRRTLSDADLRRRLGDQARRDVLEHHTWRRNAERVLQRLDALRQTTEGHA